MKRSNSYLQSVLMPRGKVWAFSTITMYLKGGASMGFGFGSSGFGKGGGSSNIILIILLIFIILPLFSSGGGFRMFEEPDE